MKNCKLCRLNKTCNDLPYICIALQYVALVGVMGFLGYLFFVSP